MRPSGSEERRRRTQLVAAGALVTVTGFWGWTFVLVKDAVADVPPFEFLAIRFAIAAGALALLWRRSLGRRTLGRPVLVVGTALACAYAFQTFGLVYTGATNAAFITGLLVVITPLLGGLVYRRLPSPASGFGVVLATLGLALLSLRIIGGTPSISLGDGLVLACAVAFSVHILALGRYSPTGDVRALSVGQLAVAAVLFTVLMPTGGVATPTPRVWFALGITSLGATAYAFAVQTWAQRVLPPTRTALILTMEPVFAGVFGFALAGERLSARGWLGAGLIVAGMLTAELGPGRRAQGL